MFRARSPFKGQRLDHDRHRRIFAWPLGVNVVTGGWRHFVAVLLCLRAPCAPLYSGTNVWVNKKTKTRCIRAHGVRFRRRSFVRSSGTSGIIATIGIFLLCVVCKGVQRPIGSLSLTAGTFTAVTEVTWTLTRLNSYELCSFEFRNHIQTTKPRLLKEEDLAPCMAELVSPGVPVWQVNSVTVEHVTYKLMDVVIL